MSPVLAMVLMAGMAVTGDASEMVSGEMANEERLSFDGEWVGVLYYLMREMSGYVQIRDGMLRSERSPRSAVGCAIVHEGGRHISLTLGGALFLGICKKDGDRFIICFRRAREGRPTAFLHDKDHHYLKIRRVRPRK